MTVSHPLRPPSGKVSWSSGRGLANGAVGLLFFSGSLTLDPAVVECSCTLGASLWLDMIIAASRRRRKWLSGLGSPSVSRAGGGDCEHKGERRRLGTLEEIFELRTSKACLPCAAEAQQACSSPCLSKFVVFGHGRLPRTRPEAVGVEAC